MIAHREQALENKRIRLALAKARLAHESAVTAAARAALKTPSEGSRLALSDAITDAIRTIAAVDTARPAWSRVGTSPAATVRVHLAMLSAAGFSVDGAAELWTRYDVFSFEGRAILTPLRSTINSLVFDPSETAARNALFVIKSFAERAVIIHANGKWLPRAAEGGQCVDSDRVFANLQRELLAGDKL